MEIKKSGKSRTIVLMDRITQAILFIRGQKVMLDSDLAKLYGVTTKVLIQAVKRNIGRFPSDFMFQLTAEETACLRSQFVTSNDDAACLRSQIVTLKPGAESTPSGRGGRRYPPYVFTEQGVAMLSSVLHSYRAIHVNIEIMRAFVRLRQMLASQDKESSSIEKGRHSGVNQNPVIKQTPFTEEQLHWLHIIRDHIAASLGIELNDFECAPFPQQGGLDKVHLLFGDKLNTIIEELLACACSAGRNETLVV